MDASFYMHVVYKQLLQGNIRWYILILSYFFNFIKIIRAKE